jgi:hypothetical protein
MPDQQGIGGQPTVPIVTMANGLAVVSLNRWR